MLITCKMIKLAYFFNNLSKNIYIKQVNATNSFNFQPCAHGNTNMFAMKDLHLNYPRLNHVK